MHEYTNALIEEKSPYLLQHAHNPVDWHAWNDETLALAKSENKPIFLSIGYSTCHWCHVMEHESFEDEAIAAVMNKYFINIKVDREERPDVDQTYMMAVQAMGQPGGWPLSVWLTPDLQPFYGGTYFPPASRYGRPGFVEIMERIHDLWANNQEGLVDQASRLSEALQRAIATAAPATDLDPSILDSGFMAFRNTYDAQNGGFGNAPKFPRPAGLSFLLRYWNRTGNEEALIMAVQTLRAMALGGIHDHLGGGFARYSVDAVWRVPHFEKMLYDQAQLMAAYTQVFQITRLPDVAAAVYDIAGYVQRDMTDKDGGFYSAEDADSVDEVGVSREGAFYVWTLEQLADVLGEEDAGLVAAYYGMTPEGNFEHGDNVLHVSRTVAEVASEASMAEEEAHRRVQDSLGKLYMARAQRQRPHLDDKVLTSWNGLMISAFSQAYSAFGETSFLEYARRAADFILKTLWDPQTRTLTRRYRDGQTAVTGFLDDHAFLALGLLDLYEASLEPRYLREAVRLATVMLEKFWDADGGGFFFTPGDAPSTIARRKDDYDGAEPSGNSIAAMVLLRLAEMTGNTEWRGKGERTVRVVSGVLTGFPETMPAMLSALDLMLAEPQQVAVAGKRGEPDTEAIVRSIQQPYLPNAAKLHACEELADLAPWLAEMQPLDGSAAAYVCRAFACQAPTTDVSAALTALALRTWEPK